MRGLMLAILSAVVAVALSGCGGTPASISPATTSSPDSIRRIDLAADLYVRQVATGEYVITNTVPWPANSVLVEMPDGTLILAGTPYTPAATRLVLDWTKATFGERQMVAINTGYHVDNAGGNQALIEAGVPVYGSDMTARLLAERAEQNRQTMLAALGDPESPAYKAQLTMRYLPPDHVFAIGEGLTLTLGGEEVQVIYPGPSQAPDKVAVYFPGRRLLFGSCMVVGMDELGNTADADRSHWPDAIRNLQQYPADIVVPGHGDRLDPGLLQHTLDLLSAPQQ